MSKNSGARILIIDDDFEILELTSAILEREGYSVEIYDSPAEAILRAKQSPFDLVLVDLLMPEIDGVDVVSHLRNDLSPQEIIVMTGKPDQERIDACKELGVHSFLIKPFSAQQLEFTVYAALYSKRAQESLKNQMDLASAGFRIVGTSQWARDIRERIRSIAKSDIPVLITGETGTGKELIAKDIHSHSHRRKKPFLAINCATLGSLAESELFGHVSGSFTGATRTTRGYIGSADGGTLFLDEIGDIPLSLQATLLRFLDSGEYMRVGEAKVRVADIRIICATNRDLLTLCQRGKFRKDLYFRIAGCKIVTSPLREHPEDISTLVWHFLHEISEKKDMAFDISGDAILALRHYDWPGNVRELRHTILHLCEQAQSRTIQLADVVSLLGLSPRIKIQPYQKAKQEAIRDFDLNYFTQILTLSKGSLKKALELTGMHKKNFYSKLKALGLSNKAYRIDNLVGRGKSCKKELTGESSALAPSSPACSCPDDSSLMGVA